MMDTVGPLPVVALGNKIDLRALRGTTEADASEALRPLGCPVLHTSAKTGENVEEAFHGLARAIVGPEVMEGRHTDPPKSVHWKRLSSIRAEYL